MNSPNPVPQVAVPWYHSRIVVGIATIVASRLIDYAQKQWHMDAAVFGITVNDLASMILDGVAAMAAYVAIHARVSSNVPIPPVVTLTKAGAQEINTQVSTTTQPAPLVTPTGDCK